ncbi:MAG: hypothetical protein R2706_18575 [Acidimicrobiales bacterium]
MTVEPLLVVDGLSVHLPVGGSPRRVLHDLSFTIGAGGTLALVGSRGLASR